LHTALLGGAVQITGEDQVGLLDGIVLAEPAGGPLSKAETDTLALGQGFNWVSWLAPAVPAPGWRDVAGNALLRAAARTDAGGGGLPAAAARLHAGHLLHP
jgi:hypothetical protein